MLVSLAVFQLLIVKGKRSLSTTTVNYFISKSKAVGIMEKDLQARIVLEEESSYSWAIQHLSLPLVLAAAYSTHKHD